MSLSRPAIFPLLKLPWLSIKCVLQHWDEFVLIYFATVSNRTRRIVQYSDYPLKEIDVHLNGSKRIRIGDQKSCECFDTCRGHYLESYTAGEELDALKNGVDFMIDVFGCTIRQVLVDGQTISKPLELGITSVSVLFISGAEPVFLADLKHLLENIKVTDEYVFFAQVSNDFHCDPQIFKSPKLSFSHINSADWVTLEILCQFDVPKLNFSHHRFTSQDIVSYITHWFNSENKKLEYLFVIFTGKVSRRDFNINHLNPMQFCEKRRSRCPLKGAEPWETTDMSLGMDILRKDGLLATFHVTSNSIFFYIWHKRFPDPV
ncbi:unnamed protein product [Caenorhabditis brenneri]